MIKSWYSGLQESFGRRIALIMTLYFTYSIFILIFLFISMVSPDILLDIEIRLYLTSSVAAIGQNFAYIRTIESNIDKIDEVDIKIGLKRFSKYIDYNKRIIRTILLILVLYLVLALIIIFIPELNFFDQLWSLIITMIFVFIINFIIRIYLNQSEIKKKNNEKFVLFLSKLLELHEKGSINKSVENEYQLVKLLINYLNYCFRGIDKKEISNEGKIILKLSKLNKNQLKEQFSKILSKTYEKPLKTISKYEIILGKQKIRSMTVIQMVIFVISSISLVLRLIFYIQLPLIT